MSGNDTSRDRRQAEQVSIAVAFDKQSMLELHLKWTQEFMLVGFCSMLHETQYFRML